MRIRELAFGCIVALVMACGSAHAGDGELRFGLDGAYPPFASPNTAGQLEGFDIDLGEAICAQLKRKCVWIRQEWDALIPALQTDRFDAILASMLITKERKEKVAFTEPYYKAKAVFVGPASSELKQITAADLDGKTVGIEQATVYGKYLQALYGNKVAVREYPTVTEAFSDLKSGRIDFVLNDANSSYYPIERDGDKTLKFIGAPVEHEILGEGVGIAVRKDNTKLRDELNAAISAIVADGRYKAINKKYFPYDLR